MRVVERLLSLRRFNGMYFVEYKFDTGHVFTSYESGSYTAQTHSGRKATIWKRREMQNAVREYEKQAN